MSTAGHAGERTPAASVASALRDAGFVRLAATPDGDALAAVGVLARALDALDVPFQASVRRAGGPSATEADLVVAVGAPDPTADVTVPGEPAPASVTAFAAARELGADPDPALALAGVIAAERPPGETGAILAAAREQGVERRAGVAVPTTDLADGLAHTTLAHAPFSGDREAAAAALADRDLDGVAEADPDHRRVASLLALSVVSEAAATPRAAETVERALRPHASAGPFATAGGYADVLDAVARERPGTGIALALGSGVREAALDAWRDHAQRAHGALRRATTGRYDGAFVADAGDGAPVETVARLLRDFRSPEPVALVVGTDRAAAAAVEDRSLGAVMREAAAAVGGTGGGRARRGYARLDPGTGTEAFVTAFREAL